MKTAELKELKANSLADLKRVLVSCIRTEEDNEFPKSITYSKGIEHPKYRITIEEIEDDFFVDSKGVKWIKVQNAQPKT
jgi:hypothetical protein